MNNALIISVLVVAVVSGVLGFAIGQNKPITWKCDVAYYGPWGYMFMYQTESEDYKIIINDKARGLYSEYLNGVLVYRKDARATLKV